MPHFNSGLAAKWVGGETGLQKSLDIRIEIRNWGAKLTLPKDLGQ